MKLTRKGFEKWLMGFVPQAPVGRPNAPCGCPIACYMADASGRKGCFTVGAMEITHHSKGTGHFSSRIDLPSWARTFVSRVDTTFPAGMAGVISASQALQVLRSA